MKITLMYQLIDKESGKAVTNCETKDITRWCIVNGIMDGSEASKNALFNRAARTTSTELVMIASLGFCTYPSESAIAEFWSNHKFDWCVVEE